MTKSKFVLIYLVLLTLGITIDVFNNWNHYPKVVLIVGMFFAGLLFVSLIGYMLDKNQLIYLGLIAIALYTLYAFISFLWVTFQDASMISPFIILLLIITPLNLYMIFHFKNRAEFNTR